MGLFSKVGDLFNDLTGATSAAKLQNQYQKEFAQNGVQWRAKDLEKAGFNKILAAGGDAANAGGAGGTTGSSGVNPIDMGMNLVQGATSALNVNAQTKNINQDTLLKTAQTQGEILNNLYKSKANPTLIKQAEQNLQLTMQQILLTDKNIKSIEANTAKTNKELDKLTAEISNINADTKYTNERARGFSTTVSNETHGAGFGGSSSHSKTW